VRADTDSLQRVIVFFSGQCNYGKEISVIISPALTLGIMSFR